MQLGVSKLALFPVTPQEDKSLNAEAAWRDDGLVQNALRLLKKELPEMVLITDGAQRLFYRVCRGIVFVVRRWSLPGAWAGCRLGLGATGCS